VGGLVAAGGIDGLIVVGVMALMEDSRQGRHGRWSARVAVVAGVAMTLAANIASAEPTWTARAVSAPVSFLLAVEVLTRSGRPRRGEAAVQRPAAADAAGGQGRRTGGRSGERGRRRGDAAAAVAAAMAEAPGASVAQLARMAGVARSTVRRVNGSATMGSKEG
jgi:hypothetical protein